MTSGSRKKRLKKVVRAAEALFGQPVERVSAPGGDGRASYKIHFKDQSVFATLRPNFRRTHLEAHVLRRLQPVCGLVPRCLGIEDDVLFQSDVGGNRLNLAVPEADAGKRADLAAEAVRSIFAIQAAARQTDLNQHMPRLGNSPEWIAHFVEGAEALHPFCDQPGGPLDAQSLCDRLTYAKGQFVKWDCRSGNAAIGQDGVLRWFDFEYSGLRHGAEDLAWLLGDEAWPLAPDTMLEIVRAEFDPTCGYEIEDYIDYLSHYLAFHRAQRVKLIVREANRRGWQSKADIRAYDDAGVHPEFGAQVCRVGAFFAARSPLTAGLSRDFEQVQNMFAGLLLASLQDRSA